MPHVLWRHSVQHVSRTCQATQLGHCSIQKMHLFTALAATCYNLYPLLPQPVQALRIAFEMEAPAEGDGMTTDLRRLYDITRSTQPAVQSSLPCGQACLWIGLCWACMNHVPQVIGINKCCLDGHIKLHSNLVSCECYYCPLLVSTTNLPSLITLLQHS